jgi:hypothetical protein
MEFRYNLKIKSNLIFYIILVIYILLAVLLFNFYQYIFTYDAIFYMNIAKDYSILEFNNAINGYWSPFFSWLLTPFLFLGSNQIYILHSAKILSLIIGFFTLIGTKFLFSKFILNKKIVNILVLSMIPVALYFAFSYISPDLLLVSILLFYFGIIFDTNYSLNLKSGLICGVLGSLAYFSKTFAFIFFVVHFVLFNIIFYFHESTHDKKVKIKKNLVLGLVIFLILSGVWVGIISSKYNELTIGTSGYNNFANIGPGHPGTEINYQGLTPPLNQNTKISTWNPLSSVQSFIYYLNIIGNNIIKTLLIFLYFSIFSLLILIIALIYVIKYKKEKVSRRLSYILITILIYSGGYSLIFVEARYLWIIYILILLIGVYLLKSFNEKGLIKNKIKNILLIILVFSFIITPIIGLINIANEPLNNGLYDISSTLKNDYNVQGNIASNNNYIESLTITSYLNSTYYGEPQKTINQTTLDKELKQNNINYYLVWETSNQSDLSYKQINTIWEFNVNGTIEYLKIYKINS